MIRNGSSLNTFSLPLLIRGLVYLTAALSFSYVTADPDLWGHIKFGGETWNLGGVAKTDSYSYTAFGQPWVNHEWLTEVIFFLIYTAMDSTGILAFKFLLGLGVIHLMSQLYLARERNMTVYLIHFLMLIPVMASGFMTRPHLMTFLFLTLLMVILQKYYDGSDRAILWAPPLMAVWVNCHGGVLAGMGLLGVVTGVEIVRTLAKKGAHGKRLATVYALSLLAVMLNPYGYDLWIFFIHSLGTPRHIGEWGPISILSLEKWPLKIMVVLFVISLFMPTRKRFWELAIIIITVVYGFKHQRHSVMIPIVMTPYLPLQISQWFKGRDFISGFRGLHKDFRITAQGILLLFLAAQIYTLGNKFAANNFKILVEPKVYPTYAAQFMEANELNGNILTPFDWGEYIIWKRPKSKVSVDGRFRTVYPEEVLTQSFNLANGLPAGRQLIENYPTEIILTMKREYAGKIITELPVWGKIYDDPISQIYIRKTNPLYEKALKNQLIRPTGPPTYQFPG